jgi:ribosomal protein S18 acetylase RimI-like enzyme
MGLGESDTRDAIRLYLRRNPGLSLVATCKRRVIGAVLCGHDGRRGYLHHLAVDKKWRRKGVGGRLVSECLDRLAGERIFKCNLFLFSSNQPGRAFWQRVGWSVRDDLLLAQKATTGGNSCASRKSC